MAYAEQMGGNDGKPGAPPKTAPPTPMRSRTATLDDPMTTQLLAEVARRAQTVDLDADSLARLVNTADEEDEDTAENPHPHLRKRR